MIVLVFLPLSLSIVLEHVIVVSFEPIKSISKEAVICVLLALHYRSFTYHQNVSHTINERKTVTCSNTLA
jgi:hypothetical protein